MEVTMQNEQPADPAIPEYLTRRQSQINILGMGPSKLTDRQTEASRLTATDQNIIGILYHNFRKFLPLEMYFSTSALARSLSKTTAYVNQRVVVLEEEYGLIERANDSSHIQIKLTTLGAAVMEGKMRVEDAKAWSNHTGFNYDDLSLERTVERAVGRRMKVFEKTFTEELWKDAKDEFRKLHRQIMKDQMEDYDQQRTKNRAQIQQTLDSTFENFKNEMIQEYNTARKEGRKNAEVSRAEMFETMRKTLSKDFILKENLVLCDSPYPCAAVMETKMRVEDAKSR